MNPIVRGPIWAGSINFIADSGNEYVISSDRSYPNPPGSYLVIIDSVFVKNNLTATITSDIKDEEALYSFTSHINKKGKGKLILSGNNTHTGDNTIEEGILVARSSGALGTAYNGKTTRTTVKRDTTLQLDPHAI